MFDGLRPYQATAAADVLSRLETDKSTCLILPTGGGKTKTAAAIVRELARRGQRVLWVAHRIELVEQAIESMGLTCGYIVSGHPSMVHGVQVIVASLQTVARRDVPDVQVVVVDEAHHIASASYQNLLERLPGAKLIGLTATPTRLDGKPLGKYFSSGVVGAQVSDLIASGHLVKPRVFVAPVDVDVSHVKKTGGDFNEAQLEAAVNTVTLRGDIVRHWQERSAGRPTVLFAVSIGHSKAIVQDFANVGVRAVHVDGTMSRGQREGALQAVRTGHASILCNVGIVTEGYDHPALETCVLARPTASLSLLFQMAGRILRPSPGKPGALILDHAGNFVRHGVLPWTNIDWLARMNEREKKKAPGTKTCPDCHAIMSTFEETCPDCGHDFTEPREGGERKPIEHDKDAQLVEITDDDLQMVAKFPLARNVAAVVLQTTERFTRGETHPDFVRYVRAAGGSIGVALNRFTREMGVKP